MKLNLLVTALLLSTTIACSSSSAVDVGTTTAGPYTFSVLREGAAPTAGAMTTMVLKPTVGGMPTSIESWIGLSTDEELGVAGVFDAADGDYDSDITVQSPLPAGSKYYFVVTTNGVAVDGSIDLK